MPIGLRATSRIRLKQGFGGCWIRTIDAASCDRRSGSDEQGNAMRESAARPALAVAPVSGDDADVLEGRLNVVRGINFLAKPFKPKDLLHTVGLRLSSSRRDDANLVSA